MQVDYAAFPDIPPNCQLNPNKNRPGTYQVFRESRVTDEKTGKRKTKRETIGQIKDGKFVWSELWLERQRYAELQEEFEQLKASIGAKALEKAKQTKALSEKVQARVRKLGAEAGLETRDEKRVVYPLEPIVLGAMMCALSGSTSCADIAQFINGHKDSFAKMYEGFPEGELTHDTVYRAFMCVQSEKFDAFYRKIVAPLIKKTTYRVICGDGQAVRATGLFDEQKQALKGAYMLMNFYDATNGVCLAQKLIDKKTNEITVGPSMLESLDIKGAIVTADAMSCQVGFVDAVLAGGADYCISLKGNQDRSWNEVMNLFATTHSDQIVEFDGGVELNSGRIEHRIVSVIRGALLCEEIKDKWSELVNGCIVRVRRTCERKRSSHVSTEDSYYISSLPFGPGAAKRIAGVIRAHRQIEDALHFRLDVNFDQDRMQAHKVDYITNRAALNKVALAMLENYRYWLWDKGLEKTMPSVRQTQMRCRRLEEAMQCIACSQGLLCE